MDTAETITTALFNLAAAGLQDHMYSHRCQNCRYSRRNGTARIRNETDASRHARRHPAHQVEITDHGFIYDIVRYSEPTFDDVPPF